MACLARVLVVGFAGLVAAAPAHAQEATPATSPVPAPAERVPVPRLEYKTVPGCPNEATFRYKLALLFRSADPFDPDAPDAVRVTFTKVPGGYRGTVQYVPAQGDPWPAESETGALCMFILEGVLGTASLRARPQGTPQPTPAPTAAPAPVPAPAPAPTAAPSLEPPDPVASSPPRVAPASFAQLRLQPPPLPPRPPMDLTIALSTSFLMTAGFTADVGPALQVGVGLRRDWFSIDLEVRGIFPSVVYARTPVDPGAATYPTDFDLSQMSALVVPCVRFAEYFAGCIAGQAALNITQDRRPSTDLLQAFAVGPRFVVEVPFAERFAAFAFGEALFGGGKGAAYVGAGPNGEPPQNVAWHPPVVSGFFGAGLSVKFK